MIGGPFGAPTQHPDVKQILASGLYGDYMSLSEAGRQKMERNVRLTRERLSEMLDYDPATGVFIWKSKGRGIRTGKVAGSTDPNGYRYIRIDGEDFLAQRLAWFWTYNEWPNILRFKDNNKRNCAIENLYKGFSLEGKVGWRSKEEQAAYGKEYRHQRRHIAREQELKRRFSIDNEEYQRRFAAQNGVCAICEKPEKRRAKNGQVRWLAVDHDHATGDNRDLLCSDCNQMIGFACDDTDILIKAIAYIRQHKKSDNTIPLRLVGEEEK